MCCWHSESTSATCSAGLQACHGYGKPEGLHYTEMEIRFALHDLDMKVGENKMRAQMAAIVSGIVIACASAWAQAPVPPPGPVPSGAVVGSGNFFSPIVADLDKAIAFYRDGLGLDVAGTPNNADANPALRNMFGLPDAQIRWSIGRPPAMRTGVEIVEVKKAGGRAFERQIQDPGAFTLIVVVRDVDAALAKVKQVGAPVVTTGGAPVTFGTSPKVRAVIVKDPDGHFVQLTQPDPLPPATAPDPPNVIGVRVRLTVEDAEKAMRLYWDALGIRGLTPGMFNSDKPVLDLLGVKGGQYRLSTAQIPTTGLRLDFLDFKGVDRRVVRSSIQDPGSTRMQLQVRDVDEAIAMLKRDGGTVVSTGGNTVELPGRGGTTTKVAIVRDPNNLFLVLLQVAPQPPRNP
jgi:catechol 2,3-dioxygenase-like lactoylglutathione lyase family enzyme